MVNLFGEFRSVRANNYQQAFAGERHNAETKLSQGQAQSETAIGRAACATGNVAAVPPAVTPAERAEQRLGMAMLRAALDCPRTANPSKWSHARSMGNTRRQELARERREKVRQYAEEGELTAIEVAEILDVAVTTIRVDTQVLRVKLKAGNKNEPSMYQAALEERRAILLEMSTCGISRAEAAKRLGVSEATVRRDIRVTGMKWDIL